MNNGKTTRKCAVCGDTPAKIHYGVLACFGCKGFFRRAVKDGRNKYVCRFENNCQVTKIERNSCRYCRFRRCLLVGMNPDFVRPDREETRQNEKQHKVIGRTKSGLSRTNSNRAGETDHWSTLLTNTQRNMLANLNNLETQIQSRDNNFEGVAEFSLKSLIADRSLARKTQNSTGRSTSFGTDLMGIDRIVSSIDFIDGFLCSIENDNKKRVSVEDKCSLISDTFLPLALIDSVARLCAAQSSNFSEDFAKAQNVTNLSFVFTANFNHICESFKKKPLSPMEFTLVRALLVCSADPSVLSNLLGEELSSTRDSLQELLFRVIKLSRKVPSSTAATSMANMISFIHQARALSRSLHDSLSTTYPRNNKASFPFNKIIADILHPEMSDLVAELCRSRSSSTVPTITFSPPALYSTETSTDTVSSAPFTCRNPSEHSFTAPRPVRPTALGFCSKLPLTLTKSIEEMLRAPGMGDDQMNRPLSSDWADGLRLTPVFNRDVVAQFFPELSGTSM